MKITTRFSKDTILYVNNSIWHDYLTFTVLFVHFSQFLSVRTHKEHDKSEQRQGVCFEEIHSFIRIHYTIKIRVIAVYDSIPNALFSSKWCQLLNKHLLYVSLFDVLSALTGSNRKYSCLALIGQYNLAKNEITLRY